MTKIIIRIPNGISHLSDYQQFESLLPWDYSFILDKTITGCGATTLFLSDSIPTILCSPRRELLHCKANDSRFKDKVYWFRDENHEKTEVINLENEMMAYINYCDTPFQQPLIPKILVTYDSFKHVVQRLIEGGCLERFRIIVDEAQTLFTDAAFKGGIEIEFFHNLTYSKRVIFLSAKPYIENYLDQIDYFKGLPYVKLMWPTSAIPQTNIQKRLYYQGSLVKTAVKIINGYRGSGYFAEKMVNNMVIQSTQAVFFLNDVSDIISIIKKCKLTPDETNIICANQDRNITRLKKLGHILGHAPKEGEPHKTFTFVTKCSFEGTDFYSPGAYTYIFSDINQKNLAIDISLDLPQIMGRQRLDSNPFRYDATFYYKTDMDFSKSKEVEFMASVIKKKGITELLIQDYENTIIPLLRHSKIEKLRATQLDGDYTSVIDNEASGSVEVVFNYFAMFNEIRAWEIQKGQYINGCQVTRSIDEAMVPITCIPEVASFLNAMTGNFENQMRMYCEFLSAYPQHKATIESLPQIPMPIKQYYNIIGPNKLRALSYIEARIKQNMPSQSLDAQISGAVRNKFVYGKFYTFSQVKNLLQEIYNELGIHRTAKATELEKLIPCEKKKVEINGKRGNGYIIK